MIADIVHTRTIVTTSTAVGRKMMQKRRHEFSM